jgi:hypothetical protein
MIARETRFTLSRRRTRVALWLLNTTQQNL